MDAVTFDVRTSIGGEWTLLRLLALVSASLEGLTWQLQGLEFAPSPAGERAESLLVGQCSSSDLFHAVAMDPQLIEGTLNGLGAGEVEQIRIVSIDGQHWDVYARSPRVFATIRAAIESVGELPQ